ncbi:hypothetical protein GQ53DRAFT_111847 [Thozetella sp. PMI_491]|nr:hypothetical protein GQ53DRAFT_111847 [Thozetella sp. PMI_491]
MEAQQFLRRQAGCCLVSSATSSRLLASYKPAFTPLATHRHASSRRRLKKALNIPPHSSFLDTVGGGAETDTIIINPPSSAPSVYNTPFKFLPKEDPRRRANLASLFSAARSASTTIAYNDPKLHELTGASAPVGAMDGEATLPPAMSKTGSDLPAPPHHLTEADVAEMRRLRAEDPDTNSVVALSRRFKCSRLFVLMCCQAPREHQDKHKARKEAHMERWGPRKANAVAERRRRFDMLFRGEL